MNKEKIYFDTSVLSAYFDLRKPDRAQLTKEFWRKIPSYEPCVSTLVIDELNQIASPALKKKLFELVKTCAVLQIDDESETLALAYIQAGILPKKYIDDALHIAAAVVHGIKLLVSWNFRHFVNIKTRQMVNLVNLKEGYGTIEIIAPPEI